MARDATPAALPSLRRLRRLRAADALRRGRLPMASANDSIAYLQRRMPAALTEPTDLQHYIQVYDDLLDARVCATMIQSFHALARFHRGNGAGVRAGLEQSRWTELDIGPLSDAGFRQRMLGVMQAGWQRYVDTLQLTIQVPFTTKTSEWILKRYEPGGAQRFQPHFDALGAVSNRYLVMLWYLNDVEQGGETAFVDLGVEVQPKAGRMLMFPPYWMYQHEGRPPISGDKYILSTYLLF